MHEFGIMCSLIEIVHDHARTHRAFSVERIGIRLGNAVEAHEDALRFAFDALSQDDSLIQNATLHIEFIPISSLCNECHTVFEHERTQRACPLCKSFNTQLIHGKEIELTSLELDIEEGA